VKARNYLRRTPALDHPFLTKVRFRHSLLLTGDLIVRGHHSATRLSKTKGKGRSAKAPACSSDEGLPVTELARALHTLKENTDEAVAHKKKLDQLNGWFEIALHNMHRISSTKQPSRTSSRSTPVSWHSNTARPMTLRSSPKRIKYTPFKDDSFLAPLQFIWSITT
jgi:hypothetical protein